jgi:hypothetical protein
MSGPSVHLRLSGEVDRADWIKDRTKDEAFGYVGSFIPSGFDGYLRLLRPAYADVELTEKVRWHEIATWSGRDLKGDSEFHSVAFPARPPSSPRPWQGRGVPEGSMDASDLAALVAILSGFTTSGDDCWMGIWEGYGPIAGLDVDDDHYPLVETANRSYHLLHGPVEEARDAHDDMGRGPNLLWPSDRAWCVATDIDMDSTLVGGSAELVAQLRACADVESVDTDRAYPLNRIDDWAFDLAEHATDEVVEHGRADIETYFGTVTATVKHRHKMGRSIALQMTFDSSDGSTLRSTSSGWQPLGRGQPSGFREEIQFAIAMTLVDHVD